MDIRKHPPTYKPRRTKGTPAWKFSRNVALAVAGAGLAFGILQSFLPAGYAFRRKIKEGYFEQSKESQVANFLFFSAVNRPEKIKEELESQEEERGRL